MSKLLPYQRANLATLLTLLIAAPDAKYDHSMYGYGYADSRETKHYPDEARGCAVGLAMANADKFKVPTPENERTAFQRLFGLNKFRAAPTLKLGEDSMYSFPHSFADAVFGKGMDARAFEYSAYRPEVQNVEDVTKNMVLSRLMQIRQTGVIPA